MTVSVLYLESAEPACFDGLDSDQPVLSKETSHSRKMVLWASISRSGLLMEIVISRRNKN